MSDSFIIILVHQAIFQGMFFAKNIILHRRLGIPIRGRNREAALFIGFVIIFIAFCLLHVFFETPFGTANLLQKKIALTLALALLIVNLIIAALSLLGLRDSWRVGVLENQKTDLVETGAYRFSRNPYFLSYLIMFIAYTILLQNIILLVLSFIGFAMIHSMVRKEEKHLINLHGEKYHQYQQRVPRYFII